ncbi:MAG: PrsW family glutamic-type intramembrane protease [Candidatus Gracilibacteria bacterium]
MALVFIGGIATVIPLLIIQKLFATFPELNVVQIIPGNIPNVAIAQLIIIIFLGMLEEIFKQTFLRTVDNKWLLVETVNDSIKLAMIAALGFSFAENIYPYFFTLLQYGSYKELMGAYFVRSLFTSAMHMSVAGIFGYYYGISKFAIDFREQSKWSGEKMYLTRCISWIFGTPQSESFREQKILRGLFIAMGIHGAFNFLVQFQLVMPALLLVIGSFGYLMFLMNRKAGSLLMINSDIYSHESAMPKKDEDVITELVSMWLKEKKYQDVINICERLLERDPNNNVIKLFKVQAVDLLEGNDPYQKTLSTLLEKKTVVNDQSQITKWIELQKKQGNTIPTNFQESVAYKKFLEEEGKKKEAKPTFQLDLNK